jgi:hypothetical protein
LNFPRNPCFGFALLPAIAAALPLHALLCASLSRARARSRFVAWFFSIHEFYVFAAELPDPFKMQLGL